MPPPLRRPYGTWLGYSTATIATIFSILHLFRIDTLIPALNAYLPGSTLTAALCAVIVILCEVFGIPFALRMKLSPLAQFMSGALLVLAPLLWLLATIWAYGAAVSTGQFGQFVSTPSGALSIVLNTVWLALAFTALWALGYDKLAVPAHKKLLSKQPHI